LEELTGERSVLLYGDLYSITNRYSSHLFDGSDNAMAFQYIKSKLDDMGYPPNTEYNHYGYYEHNYTYNTNHWKNLILTIPGVDQVDPQKLIFAAHLDDLPDLSAPGAEDNGVGAAALLEIAHILRNYQFNATIRLIWFTGEEQGLRGSHAYVLDNTSFFGDLIGVINLDMFGYDEDDDGCFEIHAGSLAASQKLGDCLITVIDAYDFPLSYDYIKEVVPSATSDHRSFWEDDVAAIEILENHYPSFPSDPYQQCGTVIDTNPYNHTANDTIANSLNIGHAFDIIKASLAAGATLAEPLGVCFNELPIVEASVGVPYVELDWQDMGGYITYRVSRSSTGCKGPWEELTDNLSASEYFDRPFPVSDLAYQVEAISPSGTCISMPGNCVTNLNLMWNIFPIIHR
jgi:leucyl aminopeptidase